VDFTRISNLRPQYLEPAFAVAALQEVPQQYNTLGRLKMLRRPAGM